MNYQQVRQYLFNNLWHGENSRTRSARSMNMIVKGVLIQPDYTRLWGTDISHWDGLVNLSVTKAMGASFTYIKAIDGSLQTNRFVENRQTAINAGHVVGPYGWLYRDANVSCVSQARAYHDLMQKYPCLLRPAIDFEPTYYGGKRSDPTFSDLRKWATEWLRLGNPKAVLYSAAYFMNPYGSIPSDLKDMFAGLWVAHYGTNNPTMPAGYAAGEWIFHQFTSSGDAKLLSPNSVNKLELDINYAKSKAVLDSLGGASEPPPTGGTMSYFQATGSQVIRTAGTVNAPVTTLGGFTQYILGPMSGSGSYAGDVIECDAPVNGYMKITRLWRNGAWVQLPASAYCGVNYLSPITFTPPPDPLPPAPEPRVLSSFMSVEQVITYDTGETRTLTAENVELK